MHSSLVITLYNVTFGSDLASPQTKRDQKPLKTKPFSVNNMKMSQPTFFNVNSGMSLSPKNVNIFL